MFVARSASRLTSSATSTLALSQSLRSICFDLTAQQREIQAHALKFAKEVIVPAAAYHDETGFFPWDIVRQAHALGFMNPGIEEKYGGPGLSHLESTLLTEALAYGCTGIQFCIIGSTLAVKPVQLAGTEAQKREYLGRQAASPSIAAYCVTEAGAGSDVAAVRTRAIRKGDEYVLTGSKSWISGGGHAQWFIVLARTAEDPSTPAGRAFTAFLVEGDAVGVSRGKKEDNMGQRCSDTRTITFEDVRVPVANVLGAVGEGFKVVMRTFDAMRPIIAAGALGLMWRCLEESARYAMERRTFGTAICNHQAVQFLLSDMAMNLELGRLATYKAASDSDLCLRNSYISSVAKCFVGDQVNVAATNAVQIFGANGYNRQYPVEKLMRDAKIYQIYGGTSEIQRTIIFRQMMDQFRATGTARV